MKKVLAAAVTFLFSTALAPAWQVQTGPPSSSGPMWGIGVGEPPPKREKPPEFRNLAGVVLDKTDSPLKDAVVYLKNRKTKAIRTFAAGADGGYRFPNLSRTEDYEVYAERKGQKSPIKTLSSLDSRTNAKIILHIEVKKEAQEEAKQEEKKEAKEEKKEEK
ncbi:MAG: carboxypeptidase-like regulatory domain-containing protein [Terriglobales bacterium]